VGGPSGTSTPSTRRMLVRNSSRLIGPSVPGWSDSMVLTSGRWPENGGYETLRAGCSGPGMAGWFRSPARSRCSGRRQRCPDRV
jgi:hypothetical protein